MEIYYEGGRMYLDKAEALKNGIAVFNDALIKDREPECEKKRFSFRCLFNRCLFRVRVTKGLGSKKEYYLKECVRCGKKDWHSYTLRSK